jgi:hypothetical protein
MGLILLILAAMNSLSSGASVSQYSYTTLNEINAPGKIVGLEFYDKTSCLAITERAGALSLIRIPLDSASVHQTSL